MPAVTDAVSTVINTATHGAVTLGTVVAWNMAQQLGTQLLWDQGKMRPSSVGYNSIGFAGSLSFYAGDGAGPVLRTAAAATLSVTCRNNAGGATKTYSLGLMKALDFAVSHTDRSPALITQQFVMVDPADTADYSAS